MNKCANCEVSNPSGVTTCYACGKPVNKRTTPPPPQNTIPCTFCGAPNLDSRESCYCCGDPLHKPEMVHTHAGSRESSRQDEWTQQMIQTVPPSWQQVQEKLLALQAMGARARS